jgi:hypothetical protein
MRVRVIVVVDLVPVAVDAGRLGVGVDARFAQLPLPVGVVGVLAQSPRLLAEALALRPRPHP